MKQKVFCGPYGLTEKYSKTTNFTCLTRNEKKKLKRKLKIAIYVCLECCKDSITVFVFVLQRTVTDFYYFRDENMLIYRRSNISSENLIKIRVFPPVEPIFGRVYSCAGPIIFWDTLNQHNKTHLLKNKIKWRILQIFANRFP